MSKSFACEDPECDEKVVASVQYKKSVWFFCEKHLNRFAVKRGLEVKIL